MNLPFKSNLPKDFDPSKKYGLILSEQQKENISKSRKGQESNHKGKTRPWAGKPRENKSIEHHTEETKARISKSKLGTPAPNKGVPMKEESKQKMSKIIVTPDGIFLSRTKAAEYYGVCGPVISHRLNKYPKEYYYISREEYTLLTGKDVI